MNHLLSNPRGTRTGFALTALAAATLSLASASSWSLGLGRMAVQSALGESLRAEIDITSISPEEAASLRVRVAPAEAYRAAGVDYSSILSGTQVSLARRGDGRPYLRVVSDRVVQEPFVDVILEVTWSSGRLVREYTLLLDPPSTRAAAPAAPPSPAPVAPVISAAPAPAARAAAPSAPSAAVPSSPSAPATPRATAPTPAPGAAARAPAGSGADEYRVREGDTLSRVAQRTLREGVSLDQMLVALWRSNPQAFVENNMNRMKSGSLLAVPNAEAVRQTPASEARQTIQAQSADFGAYRQRLASGAPAVRSNEPARQATGTVQAQVDDRKAAPASPDRLTLSQGATKAGADAKVSKDSESKEQAARKAELARNLEDLKKLKDGAGKALPPGTVAPTAPTTAAATAPVAAPVSPAPPPPPAPVVVAAAPPPAALPTSPPPVAAPAPAAPPAASASAAPSAAAAASAARPTVAAKPPAVPAVGDNGPMAALLDNPFVLPGAGIVLALLAGLGFYRWRSRARTESGETSFLESRLQPDSFFGASGGQRIDTRDASGASSSMSYSLSQLDAIGDVDPVAEADVYLAYGRDLQAEEILKEAMRSNPDRLAIRTKLLEVYAKRRDTKGYELLATQLFGLTQGEGDDWHKTQELGQQIDPENPMYAPGGRPTTVAAGGSAAVVEALGASTMPQSVLPSPSNFDLHEAKAPTPPGADDLDLDLDVVASPAAPGKPLDRTQPLEPISAQTKPGQPFGDDGSFELPSFELPDTKPAASMSAATASASAPPAYDFGDLSLDLGDAGSKAPAEPALDYSSMPAALDGAPAFVGDPSDPLVRKLELAEEFRQIGDLEGARDLLEEVVGKADGPLKTRAQSLLDGLA